MIFKTLVAITASLAIASTSVDLEPCRNETKTNLKDVVKVSPCKKTPCILKVGSRHHVSITFTPNKELTDVILDVKGILFGLPLPFLGIDGTSACAKQNTKIQDEAGQNVTCPLKANTKYVYKDSFPVLAIYPRVDVRVHYALTSENKNIVCFELPSRIV